MTLVDPNYSEKRQKILKECTELYDDYLIAKSQFHNFFEDNHDKEIKELSLLKIKKKEELYDLMPLGRNPVTLAKSLGVILLTFFGGMYTYHSCDKSLEERKKRNKKATTNP